MERLDKREGAQMRCIVYIYYYGLNCEIIIVLLGNFCQHIFWFCGVWQSCCVEVQAYHFSFVSVCIILILGIYSCRDKMMILNFETFDLIFHNFSQLIIWLMAIPVWIAIYLWLLGSVTVLVISCAIVHVTANMWK